MKRFLHVFTFGPRFFNSDMLINKPECYVCFEISHNFCERQKQNGRHLFKQVCNFVHFTLLCIEIMDIKQN